MPSNKYIRIIGKEIFQEKTAPIKYTTKVAKVMEMGSRGMERGESTHIKATKTAMMHIACILLIRGDLLFLLSARFSSFSFFPMAQR